MSHFIEHFINKSLIKPAWANILPSPKYLVQNKALVAENIKSLTVAFENVTHKEILAALVHKFPKDEEVFKLFQLHHFIIQLNPFFQLLQSYKIWIDFRNLGNSDTEGMKTLNKAYTKIQGCSEQGTFPELRKIAKSWL
jgi:hypothetical protein